MRIDEEIKAFGERLGIDNLSLNDKGVVSLKIEGIGVLSLETTEDTRGVPVLLMAVGRTLEAEEESKLAFYLDRVNWRHNPKVFYHATLSGNRLVLCSRLPEPKVTVATLENVFRFLINELAIK